MRASCRRSAASRRRRDRGRISSSRRSTACRAAEMRLVTFAPRGGAPRLGALADGAVVDLATPLAPIATSMIELLRAGAGGLDLARPALAAGLASPAPGIRHDPRTVTLLAPVPN